jgi:hypothetical protein
MRDCLSDLKNIKDLSLCDLHALLVKTNPTLAMKDVERFSDRGLLHTVIEFNVLYECLCLDIQDIQGGSKLDVQCYMECLDETILNVFNNPILECKLTRLWLHKPYFVLLNTRLANIVDEYISNS